MDIYAKPGAKVCFTASGGYDNEQSAAKAILKLGEVYTVSRTEVHRMRTSVVLREYPAQPFNSCLFEDVAE